MIRVTLGPLYRFGPLGPTALPELPMASYGTALHVVYITIVVVCRTKRCQRHLGTGQLSTSVTRSAWSADGRLILATTDSALHVWRAVSGGLVRSIALHTMAEFPLAVARGGRRNLVATGSTLHTAIRVWDLDAAVSCHPSPAQRSIPEFQRRRNSGGDGALAHAMLKPWGREYLFAPTIFSHIFARCSLNFHSLSLCCLHTIKTSHSIGTTGRILRHKFTKHTSPARISRIE